MSIPEEVRRTVAAKLVQEASLLDEYADEHILDANRAAVFAFSAAARRLAARALTGEYEVEVLCALATDLDRMRTNRAGFSAMDAVSFIVRRANKLEVSMKGGGDGRVR